MDNRSWKSAAVAGAPTAPASPSAGYPVDGDPSGGITATKPGAYWFHQVGEELRAVLTAASITPDSSNLTQLSSAIQALINSATKGYLLVRDEKAANTAGGSSVVGLQTRTLNAVVANTISGASLASNQITLPAGTYRVRASAPGLNVNPHRAQLYNVTDAAIIALGTSDNSTLSSASDAVSTHSVVVSRFTLAATKVISLRHYTAEVYATSGLGGAVNDGNVEIYSIVEIVKE